MPLVILTLTYFEFTYPNLNKNTRDHQSIPFSIVRAAFFHSLSLLVQLVPPASAAQLRRWVQIRWHSFATLVFTAPASTKSRWYLQLRRVQIGSSIPVFGSLQLGDGYAAGPASIDRRNSQSPRQEQIDYIEGLYYVINCILIVLFNLCGVRVFDFLLFGDYWIFIEVIFLQLRDSRDFGRMGVT